MLVAHLGQAICLLRIIDDGRMCAPVSLIVQFSSHFDRQPTRSVASLDLELLRDSYY